MAGVACAGIVELYNGKSMVKWFMRDTIEPVKLLSDRIELDRLLVEVDDDGDGGDVNLAIISE